ncbi:MAG: AAA family ATPase [Nevskia sp.]|nr:AAA family ATPase [Nevskia sp.]
MPAMPPEDSNSLAGPADGPDVARVLQTLLAPEFEAGWRPADMYAYRAADRSTLFLRLLLLRSRGRGRKGPTRAFQAVHHDGSRWHLGEPPHPPQGRVPYMLPVLTHARADLPAYLVQDEPSADALCGLGLIAVTSGEALPVGETDWNALRARRVRIWTDDTRAGRRFLRQAVQHAGALGCTVQVLHYHAGLAVRDHGTPQQWIAAHPAATTDDVEALDWRSLPSANPSASPQLPPQLATLCAADVSPAAVRWLWPGRIAIGKLTLIAGDPGLGKSLLTIDLAARVTRGRPWPADGSACPRGEALLLSNEDAAGDTIRPRLDAAGALSRRVHILQAVMHGAAGARLLSLQRDLQALAAFLAAHPQVRLVCIDPLTAFLGEIDSHRNADVRALLHPLGQLAERAGVAVVAVSHLNKAGRSALYRVSGSLAFVAAARASFIVTRDKSHPDRRLLLPSKNNLGQDTTGLAYRIATAANGAPRLEWEPQAVALSADEALTARSDERHSEQAEAAEWLRELLSEGAMSTRQLRLEAAGAGIAWRTLHRARQAAGAVSSREGSGREATYIWRLKKMTPAARVPLPKPGTLGTQGQIAVICKKPAKKYKKRRA